MGWASATAFAEGPPPQEPIPPMAIDRVWTVLPAADPLGALRLAGDRMGSWSIEMAGVTIDGPTLHELASPREGEPLTRHLRETLGRPIDVEDFLYWLDDVAVAHQQGRHNEVWSVPSGRARAAGILIHPDGVFKSRPRVYGQSKTTLAVDPPSPPATYPPATDGEPLGPRWSARFAHPETREQQLTALHEARPNATFPSRVGALVMQLEQQGAQVWITSSVRSPERGYLMWGAFLLSRANEQEVPGILDQLNGANSSWGLHVPILWRHPEGLKETREAGRQMADAYDVVYATERGARYSSHYTGKAVDLVAINLPRTLRLIAPDGEIGAFDLSDEHHPRDLSLEPELIAWIEDHFAFTKLRSDYPHWTDDRDR